MQAAIKAIEYYLPERVVTNSELAVQFPDWSAEKIEQKTGVIERHVVAEDECASDLGVAAAQKLFASGACQPSDVDCLLLCTQSPDYFLPTTACIMQSRLGIPSNAGALDFNLGCSGFVYGLGIAKGLIETGQARSVLLITAETYSKFLHPGDKSVRTLFGDAAAATMIQGVDHHESQSTQWIGPFVYGTDGLGAANLIVPTGGMRRRQLTGSGQILQDEYGNQRTPDNLYMNGPEIFSFTIRAVPLAIEALLSKSGVSLEEIDLFVFHQANLYILEHLRRKLKIPEERFFLAIRDCGNTVSATIPIALKRATVEGKLQPGHQVLLVGFGVGYSWGAALIRWIA